MENSIVKKLLANRKMGEINPVLYLKGAYADPYVKPGILLMKDSITYMNITSLNSILSHTSQTEVQINGYIYSNQFFDINEGILIGGRDCVKESLNALYGTRNLKKGILEVKKVIFNEPATIVFWKDGTKTVVKCRDGETFDPEKGVALCFMKKALGNNFHYYDPIKHALKNYKPAKKKTSKLSNVKKKESAKDEK